KARRVVSFHERHLAAMEYELTLLDHRAPVVITSELVNHRRRDAGSADEEDPRLARALSHNVLVPEKFSVRERRVLLTYVTRSSRMRLGCGMDHVVATECAFSSRTVCDDPGHGGEVVFLVYAEPGKPVRL